MCREVGWFGWCTPPHPPQCVGCTSVCGVWGDPPTALSGSDSCHKLTEEDTPSSLLHCSHHLEGGGVTRLVCVDYLVVTPVTN